ncbi:MoaD/ThiS family protein [Salinarimonas soli]|uniref:MoaD/ThiS family protein n=1 Tax=Salinarimonas soli TaxID=1638099 RepID=A0A5B2VVI2_9HYPH|nr:MoaD/ThiS family protein [Salinarimonas soli]KAA2242342.1 MoaD/ThiS family protein [Salinarimonas soli]
MATVYLPSSLRRYVDQRSTIAVPGETVSAVLTNLAATAQGLHCHLFAADKLRSFVFVSKNGQDIRLLNGLETPVESGDQIRILSSIAGG